MKKLSLYIFLGFILCNAGYAKEENKYYLNQLNNCSASEAKHYVLKDEGEDNIIDIFESTNLNLDCLESKFVQHLKNYPVKAWGPEDNVPFDEIIIRNQETVSNGITFDRIVITSLFSQSCGERCRFSNEAILIYKGQYWYIRGSNEHGVESKFINNDIMLVKNLMTTHRRNYLFDVNTKLFTSLPDGELDFKKDHIIVRGQKSYFATRGSFWFDSKRNYAGEMIELISDGNTCANIKAFYEGMQKAMKKQGLETFCVSTY